MIESGLSESGISGVFFILVLSLILKPETPFYKKKKNLAALNFNRYMKVKAENIQTQTQSLYLTA